MRKRVASGASGASLLGQGTYGRVFRTQEGRAVKEVISEPDDAANMRHLLEKEFHFLARLCHPNIVRVFGLSTGRLTCSIEMVALPGCDVGKLIDQGNCSLSFTQLEALQSAILHMHRCGVAHLDVKPENLVQSGNNYVFIDFGLAEHLGALVECAYVVTEGYRDPAHALCGESGVLRACTSMDVYALGVTALEMLLQRRLYSEFRKPTFVQSQMSRQAVVDEWLQELPSLMRPHVRAMLAERTCERRLTCLRPQDCIAAAAV